MSMKRIACLIVLALALASCDRSPTSVSTPVPPPESPLFSITGPLSQVSTGTSHTCAIGADGNLSCWGENGSGQSAVPAGLGSVTQVSAGGNHTCALKSDRTVACWGDNYYRQTVVPAGLGPVTQVSAGNNNACVVRSDGTVVCWGDNYYRQSAVPAGLGPVTQVSAGQNHTCAVRSDGTVVCWGNNYSGESTVPAGLGSVTQVSAQGGHTCALKSDGTVVCWGSNGSGQTSVPAGLGSVTQVSASGSYTCALKSDGTVVCWGFNGSGQTSVPAGLGSVTQVSAGGSYTCALKSDGTVVCWGAALNGNLVERGLSEVSPGVEHTCALKSDGTVVCWGRNGFGQTSVPAGLGSVTQVSAGSGHTCALKSDRTVACWGDNWSGATAVPADLGFATHVSVGSWNTCAVKSDGTVVCWGNDYSGQSTVPAGLGSVTQVSAQGGHTCALKSDGTVVCWGFNSSGQTSVPAGLGSVTQVSAGSGHTCAIGADGNLSCWGFNGSGQTSVPAGLGSVTQVSAGSGHTCALKSDRTVACWGSNYYGQSTVPAALGAVSQVRVHGSQSCAISLDGTLECWGNVTSTTFLPGTPSPGSTPIGNNVQVQPNDQTTGEPSPISLTFSNVTGSGTTTVTSGTMGGSTSPVSPSTAEFKLGNPPTYYDIETTATFEGTATVCITYAEGQYQNESKLKLLHYENGAWVDITKAGYPDTENNVICGTTTSFSPFLVAEQNIAPVVTQILLPADPVAVNTATSLTARFTDENPGDTHTASINWETATGTGSVTEPTSTVAGTVAGSYTYTAPGVYRINISVTDAGKTGSRSSALDIPAYIVVYDPSAGFVTGGGWINSPAGAYAADHSLSGKATFGFVSRYQKGATIPSGKTEFQFHAAGMDFKSSAYDWLVISGAKAQYKGVGTLNGVSGYKFLLTATDGQISGGGGVDKLRIKITDASDNIVYDNVGGSDKIDESDTQAISGGSIVIHSK
jgi:alpha-tubulin suppressor-like RCC1 family protein